MRKPEWKTAWLFVAIVLVFACCNKEDAQDAPRDRFPTSDSETGRTPPGALSDDGPGTGRVGNVHLADVKVKGFETLPLEGKQRIYHHVLAAMEGDAVFTHQRGPMNLVIRRMLDGIGRAGNKIPVQLRKKIDPYRSLFAIHHGNRDSVSGKKITPVFIPGELAAATEIAVNAGIDLGVDDFKGADLGANRLERLEAFLAAVRPWIFELDFQPEPQPAGHSYRAGDGGEIPPGLLAEELDRVVGHLQNGLSHMKPAEKAALEQLIHFLQTGSRRSYARYLELWMNRSSQIETFINFFHTDVDLQSTTGAFQAMVLLRDDDLTGLMQRAAAMANHYRRALPWGKRVKSGGFTPRLPGVYNVVVATGNAGPLTEPTMAVPADPKLAATFGQRRFLFPNIEDARERVVNHKVVPEFSWSPEVSRRRVRWSRVGRNDLLVLREVIGRGMVRSGLKKQFDAVSTTLEEMFCTLVGLYLIFDPRNQGIGLVPTEESAKALYDSYASGMLEQLSQVGDSAALSQPGMQARQVIVRSVIGAGAAEVLQDEGRFLVRVLDYQAMRAAVGQLLQDVHRIMADGDVRGAKRLIRDLGTTFPVAWRDDVQQRFDKLGLSGLIAFSFPTPVAKRDAEGRIADVVLNKVP